MLRIENLKKSYSKNVVLQLENLDFKESINWIKGKNGTGKSTLLKCIAGLISFQGDIIFKNVSIKKNLRTFLKEVNYCSTEPNYPGFLTGEQLAKFFIKSKNGSFSEIEKIMTDFEMLDYYKNLPLSDYSSGMLKKISICLSLIGNPNVILLDEPFITLDIKSINVLNDLLINISKLNKTIILTSHLEELPFEYNELNLDLLNYRNKND